MVSEWHKRDDNNKFSSTKLRKGCGVHEKGKVGSTKIPLTEEIFRDFKRHLASGYGIEDALIEINIGRSVYTRWRKENKDFLDFCEQHKQSLKKKG